MRQRPRNSVSGTPKSYFSEQSSGRGLGTAPGHLGGAEHDKLGKSPRIWSIIFWNVSPACLRLKGRWRNSNTGDTPAVLGPFAEAIGIL